VLAHVFEGKEAEKKFLRHERRDVPEATWFVEKEEGGGPLPKGKENEESTSRPAKKIFAAVERGKRRNRMPCFPAKESKNRRKRKRSSLVSPPKKKRLH